MKIKLMCICRDAFNLWTFFKVITLILILILYNVPTEMFMNFKIPLFCWPCSDYTDRLPVRCNICITVSFHTIFVSGLSVTSL